MPQYRPRVSFAMGRARRGGIIAANMTSHPLIHSDGGLSSMASPMLGQSLVKGCPAAPPHRTGDSMEWLGPSSSSDQPARLTSDSIGSKWDAGAASLLGPEPE